MTTIITYKGFIFSVSYLEGKLIITYSCEDKHEMETINVFSDDFDDMQRMNMLELTQNGVSLEKALILSNLIYAPYVEVDSDAFTEVMDYICLCACGYGITLPEIQLNLDDIDSQKKLDVKSYVKSKLNDS